MNNRKNKFFRAVKINDYIYIKDYLKRGLNVNCKNRDGYTGLHKAIFANNIEMARYLIQNGILINDMSCHYAAAMDRKEIIEILIEYGVNVNVKDYSGRTPLHWASQEGYTDVADLLIKNGAQINAQEGNEQTPLYIASAEGHYDDVKQLLECGAKVDIPSVFGVTPFCIACAFENYREAKLLLKYNADINYRDSDGRIPLFYAKIRGIRQLIEFLLNNGADSTVIDNYGISISDLDDHGIRNKIYEDLF